MTILTISLPQLAIVFIPVVLVLGLMWRWQLGVAKASYALSRMLGQLFLIGYVLVFIFNTHSGWLVSAVLGIMLIASAWISLNTVKGQGRAWFLPSLAAIILGGLSTLFLITFGVLQLDPWYTPQYMIPLAGMVLANSMNSVSLAAERLLSELNRNEPYEVARITAFQTAMIPVINSLFAVGLVALPGMMTGQILSGVSPFIAARYQIMIMAMMFGSAGLSTACFLFLVRSKVQAAPKQLDT